MKITCQSCQSKYNVADKKVQGKIVRIRCRKCAATIVVNGSTGEVSMAARATGAVPDEPAVSVASARGGAAPAQGATWHVNVGDGEPRTMTLAELIVSYNAGHVTQDMLVWSEGMDQWQPLAETAAVVAALRGDASAAETASQVTETAADGVSGAEMMPPGESMFDQGASDDATRIAVRPAQGAVEPAERDDPPRIAARAPAAGAAQAAAPPVEAKRAAVGKRETRGRDLFSTYAGEELQASAQTAANMVEASHDDGKLTGQRNENSLLFSLAVLTKSADERAPSPEAPTKEDSGIIDLKALVARSESMRPATRAAAVDMFTSPLGLVPPTLADLGAPDVPGPKSKAPLLVAAIAGVAVLLLLGIVIGVKLAGAGSAPPPTASAVGPIEAPSATASAEPSATAAPMPSESAAPAASAAPKKAAHPGGGIAKPAGVGNAPAHAAPNALPPSPAPKKGGDCGCNGDLMCMMKCSTTH